MTNSVHTAGRKCRSRGRCGPVTSGVILIFEHIRDAEVLDEYAHISLNVIGVALKWLEMKSAEQ
jgi:hypothetical protein